MNDAKGADVVLVCGARPNFVKVAALHRAITRRGRIGHLVVHTGQHDAFEMSRVFFQDLDLPEPDMHLGAGPGSRAQRIARIMAAFEQYLPIIRPRIVVVVGDVDSTLACSLAAVKAGVALAHVEAGLRSFDRSMPEEINRVLTDAVSDILYTPSDDGTRNLVLEGIPRGCIRQVGNVMVDTLLEHRSVAETLTGVLPDRLGKQPYALATVHRPANVDGRESLERIVTILEDTSRELAVVFPVHPRTRANLDRWGLAARLGAAGVHVTRPERYLRFLRLMLGATLVLTDSGGVQEETTVLGVPCLTLRENTERPITVDLGTNLLVGFDRERIQRAVHEATSGRWKPGQVPPDWDGRAADRIAEHLALAVRR
jgi:UDP-N-acetylglucosamine 2-epimerase (non-hydrolysing)